MTLVLVNSNDIEVKTYGDFIKYSNKVHFGEYDITLNDFLSSVFYVLVNSDLEPNDLRLKFIEVIKEMKIIDSPNKGEKRLDYKDYWSIHPPSFETEK